MLLQKVLEQIPVRSHNSLARAETRLSKLQRELSKFNNQYTVARDNQRSERKALAKADSHIWFCEQAQELVQQVAQKVQQQAHNRIASVVTRCLEAIFEDPYEFKIHFDRKRGRTEARLVFYRDGEEILPMSGSGGGVLDVAAFALRLACMLLTKPPVRRVIVLDEPFKHLKPPDVYGPKIVALLKSLAKDFKVQFIMVQNLPEFQTGHIVEIEK